MKNPSQYHIQKRKDGRYVVTVMFKGKRLCYDTNRQNTKSLCNTCNNLGEKSLNVPEKSLIGSLYIVFKAVYLLDFELSVRNTAENMSARRRADIYSKIISFQDLPP